LDEVTGRIYAFERGMQGPAMTLQCRGICVDEKACWKAVQEVEADEHKVEHVLNEIAEVWWGKTLNPRSPAQLKVFLYEKLGLPPQRNKKGDLFTSVEAIEALQKKAPWAWMILQSVLRARELRKQLGFLNAKRSPDGKLRASFNVGATETGRWSSSKNCFWEGLNFQNVYKKLRYIFIPTPGRKMGNADLKQAESLVVAHLSGDKGYIAAHRTKDTHTAVAKMIWAEHPWPDDEEEEGVFARKPGYYRHFSMRDLAKRFQHGTNYGASEYAMGRILHIPLAEARKIINRYFSAFPGIATWHKSVKAELRRYGVLTTPLGRRRQFFDRVWEGQTQREGISYIPQSLVGDILNIGLYRVWREMDGDGLWLLNQGHDSILFEYDPAREDEILARVRELMEVEVEIKDEVVVIPVDIGTGGNWLEACGD
jgi:DNA polymerase-1